MEIDFVSFIVGFFVSYVLFVLDEVYTYFRNRRLEKKANKENTK